MSKPLSALLWKERMESWRMGFLALLLFGMRLYGQTTAGLYHDSPNPLFGTAALGGLSVMAFFLGAGQTLREAAHAQWAFALHRPASSTKIFGAKLIVGFSIIVAAMLIVSLLGVAWLAMPGDQALLPGQSIWRTAIGDCCSAFAFYAAGLSFGSQKGTWFVGIAGFAAALAGLFMQTVLEHSIPGLAASAILTAALVAAAWSRFFRPSDHAEVEALV